MRYIWFYRFRTFRTVPFAFVCRTASLWNGTNGQNARIIPSCSWAGPVAQWEHVEVHSGESLLKMHILYIYIIIYIYIYVHTHSPTIRMTGWSDYPMIFIIFPPRKYQVLVYQFFSLFAGPLQVKRSDNPFHEKYESPRNLGRMHNLSQKYATPKIQK